ncbi:L-dopachrome tautomerase yellow-f2-like [Trichoplusia ni]|uniref:L-dopachrome tautomerase yellow-f2-like n=1 Tax=Trichoplusia ni TaxID=7111 RepID=A0A7E5X649_TRINI|nr:L-dopachrome tautomerase yellow-f2-like [Trichoplusia ni]
MSYLIFAPLMILLAVPVQPQRFNNVGKLTEVFAWKQMTYDINGIMVLRDRFAEDDLAGGDRDRRSADGLYFNYNDDGKKNWEEGQIWHDSPTEQPTTPTVDPNDEIGRFFVQYNNVPMGVEKVGNRLFITIPRRRYGIPATLNYIDLSVQGGRSPPLTPYPDMARSTSMVSVYRTRADECGRLWMVDTGTIEIPNNPRYMQTPAIVVYDLRTDRQILRYTLKSTDLPARNTPTGLASITVVIKNGDCSNAYAYIADVVTYGIIVYSLKENDSWRHSHNYFHFNPTAGNMRVAGQSFQWNDGVFSIAAGPEGPDGCRQMYFHPMVSHQEFSVSSCELETRTANQTAFQVIGHRGTNSQSTMHGYHAPSRVMFFAEVGRDAVSCWHTDKPLAPGNMGMLAQDQLRMSYPSDLHVTDDEVWVMANSLPRFIYSRLNPNQYNFFVYRAKVADLIAGTVCAAPYGPNPFYPGNFFMNI